MKMLKNSRGIALFLSIAVMAIFLFFLSASFYLVRVDSKITANLKLGTQAIEVADAGLQHAVAVIETGFDFDDDLALCGGNPPCPIRDGGLNVDIENFPFTAGFSYTVTVENDPFDINFNGGTATDDTNSLVVLTSTAIGPNDTKSEVQAYVGRSSAGFNPLAALYVPASSETVTFNGTSFAITGNDTGYDGLPAPNPKPTVSGVATVFDADGNDPVGDAFRNALGSNQTELVKGYGYSDGPPIIPSINPTDQVLDINQMAQNFFNHPSAVKYNEGLVHNLTNCPSSNPCTLGTDASPQITYIKEGLNHVHLTGNVTGSGVLVIEGNAHIYGNFTFHGLVIHIQPGALDGQGFGFVDDPEPLSLQGNAKIFGGVMIEPVNGPQRFFMKGNTGIYYNSNAMTMANNLCSSCLPQPARITAWLDK